jgi:hypothetical protein
MTMLKGMAFRVRHPSMNLVLVNNWLNSIWSLQKSFMTYKFKINVHRAPNKVFLVYSWLPKTITAKDILLVN